MAYKTEELEAKALEAIKANGLHFIDEVVSFLPCSRSTFYAQKLDKSDAIKEALEENRTQTKAALRKKWAEGDNATTQVALYKLLSGDEEFSRLTGQQIDHTTKGEKITTEPGAQVIWKVNRIEIQAEDNDGE